MSYNTWKGTFGGDPAIIGKQVVLNGQNYSIVGVVPQEFKGIISIVTPALWVPLMQFDQVRLGSPDDFDRRGNNSHNVIARRKPGVSYDAANERMKALVVQLRAEHPGDYKESGITVVRQSDAGIHPTMRPAQVGLSSVVMAVVMILLLVSCVNVANLFLARASAGLFLRNLKVATAADKGFASDHLLVAQMDPSLQGYTRARSEEFYRSLMDRLRAMPEVREVGLGSTIPLSTVQSMEKQLGIALLPARLIGAVLGIFGLLGLVLAAIGTYGVMAYSVSQRTREIGIRMAIGAAPRDVVRLVMRQGMTLVGIGIVIIVIGLAGAFGASRVIRGVLYGGGENDLLTFAAVPMVLAAVAMLAIWIPARRAAAMNPLVALRQE